MRRRRILVQEGARHERQVTDRWSFHRQNGFPKSSTITTRPAGVSYAAPPGQKVTTIKRLGPFGPPWGRHSPGMPGSVMLRTSR